MYRQVLRENEVNFLFLCWNIIIATDCSLVVGRASKWVKKGSKREKKLEISALGLCLLLAVLGVTRYFCNYLQKLVLLLVTK